MLFSGRTRECLVCTNKRYRKLQVRIFWISRLTEVVILFAIVLFFFGLWLDTIVRQAPELVFAENCILCVVPLITFFACGLSFLKDTWDKECEREVIKAVLKEEYAHE